VENHDRVRKGASTHERQRRDLDLTRLQRALDDPRVHHVEQRVVDRAQIGIDLLAHVARKKAQPLAGLDGWARENDAVYFLALEQLHSVGDGEPGLPGAGRPGAEHERPALERAQVSILPGRTRAHRALAQVDLFEIASRGLRIEIEQRALRDREANRAFDVAGGELGAALELVIEAFEHAPRLLAGFARA